MRVYTLHGCTWCTCEQQKIAIQIQKSIHNLWIVLRFHECNLLGNFERKYNKTKGKSFITRLSLFEWTIPWDVIIWQLTFIWMLDMTKRQFNLQSNVNYARIIWNSFETSDEFIYCERNLVFFISERNQIIFLRSCNMFILFNFIVYSFKYYKYCQVYETFPNTLSWKHTFNRHIYGPYYFWQEINEKNTNVNIDHFLI